MKSFWVYKFLSVFGFDTKVNKKNENFKNENSQC